MQGMYFLKCLFQKCGGLSRALGALKMNEKDSEGRFWQSVRNTFSKSEFLSCYRISGYVQIENIV